jgi:hypothetical protein
MLRGWKSASCSGFPALSSSTDGDVIEVVRNLPATKNIPMLSNQRLRPIPFTNPPVSVDRLAMHFFFSFDLFYIVYFRLSKWDKAPGWAFAWGKCKCRQGKSPLSRSSLTRPAELTDGPL